MIADDLRLHIGGIDAEVRAQMHAKTQAVEERAGAEDALVAGNFPRDVGERIRRIADGDENGLRSGANDC